MVLGAYFHTGTISGPSGTGILNWRVWFVMVLPALAKSEPRSLNNPGASVTIRFVLLIWMGVED